MLFSVFDVIKMMQCLCFFVCFSVFFLYLNFLFLVTCGDKTGHRPHTAFQSTLSSLTASYLNSRSQAIARIADCILPRSRLY